MRAPLVGHRGASHPMMSTVCAVTVMRRSRGELHDAKHPAPDDVPVRSAGGMLPQHPIDDQRIRESNDQPLTLADTGRDRNHWAYCGLWSLSGGERRSDSTNRWGSHAWLAPPGYGVRGWRSSGFDAPRFTTTDAAADYLSLVSEVDTTSKTGGCAQDRRHLTAQGQGHPAGSTAGVRQRRTCM